MAIFHLTTKPVSRGKGQSAIAAAAYRSGQRLTDEQTGEIKHYKARAERIQFEGVFAPNHAPDWARDRQQLWNHVEAFEKRKDSRLAREIEIALPHELTDRQREWLVKDFVREQFTRKGFAVDVAIHAPEAGSDERNYHAHLLVTTRTIGAEEFSPKAAREQNSRAQLNDWREEWAQLVNRHLERHGHEARIDHRSLFEQGIDRIAGIHLGYAASQMACRGAQSDRFDQLIDIMERNDAIQLTRGGEERAPKRDVMDGAIDGALSIVGKLADLAGDLLGGGESRPPPTEEQLADRAHARQEAEAARDERLAEKQTEAALRQAREEPTKAPTQEQSFTEAFRRFMEQPSDRRAEEGRGHDYEHGKGRERTRDE